MTREEIEMACVNVRARDIRPWLWALPHTVRGNNELRIATIVMRGWNADGSIKFLLDGHNTFSVDPDETVGVVAVGLPFTGVFTKKSLEEEQERFEEGRTKMVERAREQLRMAAAVIEINAPKADTEREIPEV